MNKKVNPMVKETPANPREIDSLYVEFLDSFYGMGDRRRARKIAASLQLALADSQDFAESIRGEEIRSLVLELHGDLKEATRSREAEIRKILELHALAAGTPGWDYAVKQYDFSDVSDRLDLLAILYAKQGNAERAIATLRESKQYCISHQIPFDSQDVLDEFERARPATHKNGGPAKKRRARTV